MYKLTLENFQLCLAKITDFIKNLADILEYRRNLEGD